MTGTWLELDSVVTGNKTAKICVDLNKLLAFQKKDNGSVLFMEGKEIEVKQSYEELKQLFCYNMHQGMH